MFLFGGEWWCTKKATFSSSVHQYFPSSEEYFLRSYTHTHTHTHHYQKLFASTAFWFTLNKKGESFCCLFIYCWQSRPFSLSPSVADSVHVRVFAPFSVNIFLSIQVEILCVKCMLIGLNYKVIATNPFIPTISFNVGCVGSIQHHLTHRSHSHRVIYFKWYKALPSH